MRCLVLLVLAILAPLVDARAGTLERVVMVSRHGVRPPTRSDEICPSSVTANGPAWPVAPGDLAPHGAVPWSEWTRV